MAKIRVIGGKAKGRKLEMVPSGGSRPVGDRVKEALFSILQPGIKDANFLDLFAGTGSVGIEALSRGAGSAVFLDTNRAAIQTIERNLDKTNLKEMAVIIYKDALAYLERESETSFDIVYIAPPQFMNIWQKALETLDRHPSWLNPDCWVIAQIHPDEYESLHLNALIEFDTRRYGNTMLVFYEHPGT